MKRILIATAALVSLLIWPSLSLAEEGEGASKAALEQRVEDLERELKALKEELSEPESEAAAAEEVPEAEEPEAGAGVPPAGAAATPAREHTVYWHLAGYAEAGVILSDDASGGPEDTFVAGQFNPGFHFQYRDLVLAEAELEVEVEDDGDTAIELEYAHFNILLHDYVTFGVGKFLSPVGQFQERLHPGWINKLADAPAGFGHDGAQPGSEVGVQLRGGVPLGGTVLNYAIAVGNGPRSGHEGNVEFEGFGTDDNDNKAFSGRLGFLPVPYLEVGASFLSGEVSGEEGHVHGEEEPLDPTDADVFLWGVDAAYTRGPWDVRAEYLNLERDSFFTSTEDEHAVHLLDTLEQEAWYAQIAYRLSGLTEHRVLGNFEPVFRYGELNIDGLEELEEHSAEHRYDFGLNYWIAPSIVARGVVQWREFTGGGGGHGHEEEEEEGHEDADNTDVRYLFQFAYGF